jgi:hypothetical protein
LPRPGASLPYALTPAIRESQQELFYGDEAGEFRRIAFTACADMRLESAKVLAAARAELVLDWPAYDGDHQGALESLIVNQARLARKGLPCPIEAGARLFTEELLPVFGSVADEVTTPALIVADGLAGQQQKRIFHARRVHGYPVALTATLMGGLSWGAVTSTCTQIKEIFKKAGADYQALVDLLDDQMGGDPQ